MSIPGTNPVAQTTSSAPVVDSAATVTDLMKPAELDGLFQDLVQLAKQSKVQTGFGYLGADGSVDPQSPVDLYITCRMTHVFALAQLLGNQEAAEYVAHGVRSLTEFFQDPVYGGWFASIASTPAMDGTAIPIDDSKMAYAHAFVLLAATSAAAAGAEGAMDLLLAARTSQDEHWYRPDEGRVVESWDRAFSRVDTYRGLNSNMHTTEAYISAYDLVNDRELLDRAVSILKFVAHLGSSHNWRLPEHFSTEWYVEADYNSHIPSDPFRPFGATPGHGFEWARLMLHARGSLLEADGVAPEWMLPAAINLYQRAAADGWSADGAPGFIYTTDLAGLPVVRQRMHWVAAEAINTAVVLLQILESESGLPDWFDNDFVKQGLLAEVEEWWSYSKQYLLAGQGRWRHELDTSNRPADTTWPGFPDAYHVAQMLLLPGLSPSPTFAAAVKNKAAR